MGKKRLHPVGRRASFQDCRHRAVSVCAHPRLYHRGSPSPAAGQHPQARGRAGQPDQGGPHRRAGCQGSLGVCRAGQRRADGRNQPAGAQGRRGPSCDRQAGQGLGVPRLASQRRQCVPGCNHRLYDARHRQCGRRGADRGVYQVRTQVPRHRGIPR